MLPRKATWRWIRVDVIPWGARQRMTTLGMPTDSVPRQMTRNRMLPGVGSQGGGW